MHYSLKFPRLILALSTKMKAGKYFPMFWWSLSSCLNNKEEKAAHKKRKTSCITQQHSSLKLCASWQNVQFPKNSFFMQVFKLKNICLFCWTKNPLKITNHITSPKPPFIGNTAEVAPVVYLILYFQTTSKIQID